jgi:hypothetical protein
MGELQSGCFIMENPIGMDGLGVPPFEETSAWVWVKYCFFMGQVWVTFESNTSFGTVKFGQNSGATYSNLLSPQIIPNCSFLYKANPWFKGTQN